MAHLWVTLLGRPGAGKTTVGDALASGVVPGLGTVHYVSGSRLLEQYIDDERESWKEIKANKDKGLKADPSFTHALLGEHIQSLEGGIVLLDGFPKTPREIAMTEEVLGGQVDMAILVDCPANECMARIDQRLVCGGCGAVARMQDGVDISSPCRQGGCDGTLIRRKDDDCEERVLVQGNESAVELRSHYEQLGRLVVVDALQSQEALIADVAVEIEVELSRVSPQNGG